MGDCLFGLGSDGPRLHPGLELHKIRLLGLPVTAQAMVLGGNVLRLIRFRTPVLADVAHPRS